MIRTSRKVLEMKKILLSSILLGTSLFADDIRSGVFATAGIGYGTSTVHMKAAPTADEWAKFNEAGLAKSGTARVFQIGYDAVIRRVLLGGFLHVGQIGGRKIQINTTKYASTLFSTDIASTSNTFTIKNSFGYGGFLRAGFLPTPTSLFYTGIGAIWSTRKITGDEGAISKRVLSPALTAGVETALFGKVSLGVSGMFSFPVLARKTIPVGKIKWTNNDAAVLLNLTYRMS